LVTNCHSMLARWRNHFSQLLSVHGVSDVRQTEIHTTEPLLPEPSAFETEMASEKLRRHKSPAINQIPAELFKQGVERFALEIRKLINSIWNKEESPEEWKESFIVPICQKGDKTDYSNYRGISLVSVMYKILSVCCQGLLHMQKKLLRFFSVDFDTVVNY